MPAFSLDESLEALDRQNAEDAVKIVEDLARYDEVIERSRPDVVIETGTLNGWSALWFARRGLRVITIDVRPTGFIAPSVTKIVGDSADWSVMEMAAGMLKDGQRVMVVLDSDHHTNHVVNEIKLYGPLVSPGCYLVVEDTIVDLIPHGRGNGYGPYLGPLAAVRQLLVDNPDWQLDEEIDQMFPVSMSPTGWWRRAQ